MLQGKKTYIVAVATVAYAAAGVYLGKFGLTEAVSLVTPVLGLGALRAAVGRLGA